MDIDVHVSAVDGTQMAAKITGTFSIDGRSFEMEAIAFGRIGGQNIGIKLGEKISKELAAMGHDPEEVAMEIQKKLIHGDMTIPEGLKKESFADG